MLGEGLSTKSSMQRLCSIITRQTFLCVQVPPSYSDLEGRFYDELEASAEEAVRDALYGECLITCFVEWRRRQAHAPQADAARLVLRLVNTAHACFAWYD